MDYIKTYEFFNITNNPQLKVDVGDVISLGGKEMVVKYNKYDEGKDKSDMIFVDMIYIPYNLKYLGRRKGNWRSIKGIKETSIIHGKSDTGKINKGDKPNLSSDLKMCFPELYLENIKSDFFYSVDIGNVDNTVSYISNIRREKQEMRVGRFLSRFLPVELKNSIMENIVNTYKSRYKIIKNDFYFEIVKGEDIRKWYLYKNYVEGGGELSNSCMRHKRCQKFLDIYTDNSACQMLILKANKEDNKILGRALIWDTDKGKFMDRIYTRYDSDKLLFIDYAKKKDWIIRTEYPQEMDLMVVQLDKDPGPSQINPFMDTFKFYYIDDKILSNDEIERGGEYEEFINLIED